VILGIGCAAAFALGLYAVLTRRDLIAILAGAEVMLGSANVQLYALAAASATAGATAFALVALVVTAAEAAVGLALVITAFKRTRRRAIDEFTEVRG
jgi:NADH-quinone oxidoreductase subunit K